MKKLITIATLLGLALLCMGNVTQYHSAVARIKAGGGVSLLLEEDAEGTGTPSGWTNGGTPDWDYTTTVLAGSESLSTSNGSHSTSNTSLSESELHGFFLYRTNSIANTPYVVAINGTGIYARLRSAGSWRIYDSSGTLATGGSGAADTTYYIWFRYVAGTGADGIFEWYVSTSGTKPGAPTISSSSHNSTANATGVNFDSNAASTISIWDNIKLDSSAIGDQ